MISVSFCLGDRGFRLRGMRARDETFRIGVCSVVYEIAGLAPAMRPKGGCVSYRWYSVRDSGFRLRGMRARDEALGRKGVV